MSNFYRSPKTIGGSLFEARARNTDPDTSHAAAESVKDLTEKQWWILRVFKSNPLGLSDSQLLNAYEHALPSVPPQSDSGIRTRRAELVKQGLVVDSGRRVTLPSGRQSIVWRVA